MKTTGTKLVLSLALLHLAATANSQLKWCISTTGADENSYSKAIDNACTKGIDCSPIRPGGVCYDEQVQTRASYAMNAFYQTYGQNDFDCDFSKTAIITLTDPSYGECRYPVITPVESDKEAQSGPNPTATGQGKPILPTPMAQDAPKSPTATAQGKLPMPTAKGGPKPPTATGQGGPILPTPTAQDAPKPPIATEQGGLPMPTAKGGPKPPTATAQGGPIVQTLNTQGGPKPPTPTSGGSAGRPGKKWCVAKPQANTQNLQTSFEWLCNQVDCSATYPGAVCFDSDVRSRTSYAMNTYFQIHGRRGDMCDFAGTAVITVTDPSHGPCKFDS